MVLCHDVHAPVILYFCIVGQLVGTFTRSDPRATVVQERLSSKSDYSLKVTIVQE